VLLGLFKSGGDFLEKNHKIGIIGGTFDPIHFGHLIIAENACEQFGLDCVIFIPTGNSPHKDNEEVTDGEHRMAMIRRAVLGNEHFLTSRIEMDDPEVCYTYRTLEKIAESDPDAELYFILGGDSIAYFKDWRRPDIICKYAKIIVGARDDVEADALKKYADEIEEAYHTKVHILSAPAFDISSHLIRERIRNNRSVRYFLPDEVIRYIEEHELYGKR